LFDRRLKPAPAYVGDVFRTPAVRRGRGKQWTFRGANDDYATLEIAAHHLSQKEKAATTNKFRKVKPLYNGVSSCE
jgi:hypothetical protein